MSREDSSISVHLEEKNKKSNQIYVELPDDLIKKVKAIAYWERKKIKEVLTESVEQFIVMYGDIKPIPEEKKPILDLSKIKKK